MSLAVTNKVTPKTQSRSSLRLGGSAVNPSIPVGGLERWKRQAIEKVISFSSLGQNWDGRGSQAPAFGARQTAVELLLNVPGVLLAPRVVPVSGGGFHFEWTMGNRELEVSISGDHSIEVLRVENGMPIDDDQMNELPAIFGWLGAR